MLRQICVFCGSAPGRQPVWTALGREVGAALARAGLGVVTGGGGGGMMQAVADGALAAGGRVTGVIPGPITRLERAHPGLTEMHVVSTMHERKQKMADLCDAYVMLPGGFGTLEEFFEAVTWAQLGMHRKPCVLVNAAGYFDRLLAMVDHAGAEGFVSEVHRSLVVAVDGAPALVPALLSYRAPELPRWMSGEQS